MTSRLDPVEFAVSPPTSARCRLLWDRLKVRAKWGPEEVGTTEWRVILAASGGALLLPDHRIELNNLPAADGSPTQVVLTTRYQDVGLDLPLPRELLLDATVTATSIDEAFGKAGSVAGGLAVMISFAVNAYVDSPQKWIAYQSREGLGRRKYGQNYVDFEMSELPHPGRVINAGLLLPFLQAVTSADPQEVDRIGRTISQYNLALANWSLRKRPLALAHLYMALEALAPVWEERLRVQGGYATSRDFADSRGVDVSRSNWNDVHLGWIRRDEICRGDKAAYDDARAASNGFEHGFMAYAEIRAAAEQHSSAMLGYLRDGVIGLLDLPAEVASELSVKAPVDISPMVPRIEGEMVGQVKDPTALALPDYPFPFAEFSMTLDSVSLVGDRFRISPRSNFTIQFAPGVRFRPVRHGTDLGLNDPVAMEFEPGKET